MTDQIPARFPCHECKGNCVKRVPSEISTDSIFCSHCNNSKMDGTISRAEMMHKIMISWGIMPFLSSSSKWIARAARGQRIYGDEKEYLDPALAVIECAIKAGLLDPSDWRLK